MTGIGVGKHVIFYDGECGFCHDAVSLFLKCDQNKDFLFAPLQGETAKILLQEIPKDLDSIILLENYKYPGGGSITLYSQAIFRSMWLLGGRWKAAGWLSFLPLLPFDWLYRMFAAIRYKLRGKKLDCLIPTTAERSRFLP